MPSFLRTTLIVCLAAAAAARAEDLKLSRVALFNSGVGYFQLDGQVTGNAEAELRFRTGQIDDIIKSLVLMDLDGGAISAVQYPTRDPIEKTLRSFGVDITGKPTLGQLLDQLRGVEVEIAAATPVSGMIFGVEKQKTAIGDGQVVETEIVTLMTPSGLRSLRLSEIGDVRIKDAKVESELKKALATLAQSHDADKKAVTLSFAGQGQRRVRCGYLLETPIWKTSYRLVLADGKKPYLQGWATVENTTESDWNDVRLTLVSGRPISFTMDMYTPIYVARPREELELYASLRPPSYEAGSPAQERDRFKTFAARMPSAAPRSAGRGGLAGGGGGFGGGGGEAADAAAESMDLNAMASSGSVQSVATAQQAGELFAYDIQTPVTLRRQQSAMLPIATAEVAGEKLSIYNPATHPKYPLNGLQFTNSTELHLMQGPVTVFDGNQYAGDAKLPDLRPGEKRLVAYALDLACEVEQTVESRPTTVTSIRIGRGFIISKRKSVDARTYKIRNKDAKAKSVILEQPVGMDWKLVEPAEAYEKTPALRRFRVEVAANSEATLKVVLEHEDESSVWLSSMGGDGLDVLLRERVTSEAVKKAIVEVARRRTEIDALVSEKQEREQKISSIVSDQDRLRENIKSLPKESDLVRRYLKRLDAQETELEQLRLKVAELDEKIKSAREALEQYLQGLTLE